MSAHKENRDDAVLAQTLSQQIQPILAGHTSSVQGAVLADLLALWLAGHHHADGEDATRTLRAELLAMHCFSVRQLVPINARAPGTTP